MKLSHAFRYAGALLRPNTPSYLIYFVTARCNARCRMCFYGRQQEAADPSRELSLDEIDAVSKNTGQIIQLSLSGGEPFLRDDLEEVVSIFYRNSRPLFVTIPTNATLPEKIPAVVERIVSRCPRTRFVIALSIDGIGRDHDEIRRLPGAFDRLMETYGALKKLRPRYDNVIISASVTVSPFNAGKIEDILDHIIATMEVDNIELIYARGEMREKTAETVDAGEYLRLVRRLARRFRPARRYGYDALYRGLFGEMYRTLARTVKDDVMVRPCLAGRKLVVLREEGTVDACEMPGGRFTLGNVRDFGYDVRRLLRSPPARKVKRSIRETKCHCSFECAIFASLCFNPFAMSRAAARSLFGRGINAGKPEMGERGEDPSGGGER